MPERVSAKRVGPVANRGFTLPELVMVLLVVAVLAVFAVPRLELATGFGERAYHDKLKAGLQFARKAAVASRRYVCVALVSGNVEFKLNPNDYESVSVATLPGSCTNNLALPVPDSACGGAANRICPPSGVAVSGSDFWFDARGGASAAVTFSSTGQADITVEPETGYVY